MKRVKESESQHLPGVFDFLCNTLEQRDTKMGIRSALMIKGIKSNTTSHM